MLHWAGPEERVALETENRSANQAVDRTEDHPDCGTDRPAGIIGFAANTNVQSSTAIDEWVHRGATGWTT